MVEVRPGSRPTSLWIQKQSHSGLNQPLSTNAAVGQSVYVGSRRKRNPSGGLQHGGALLFLLGAVAILDSVTIIVYCWIRTTKTAIPSNRYQPSGTNELDGYIIICLKILESEIGVTGEIGRPPPFRIVDPEETQCRIQCIPARTDRYQHSTEVGCFQLLGLIQSLWKMPSSGVCIGS